MTAPRAMFALQHSLERFRPRIPDLLGPVRVVLVPGRAPGTGPAAWVGWCLASSERRGAGVPAGLVVWLTIRGTLVVGHVKGAWAWETHGLEDLLARWAVGPGQQATTPEALLARFDALARTLGATVSGTRQRRRTDRGVDGPGGIGGEEHGEAARWEDESLDLFVPDLPPVRDPDPSPPAGAILPGEHVLLCTLAQARARWPWIDNRTPL